MNYNLFFNNEFNQYILSLKLKNDIQHGQKNYIIYQMLIIKTKQSNKDVQLQKKI